MANFNSVGAGYDFNDVPAAIVLQIGGREISICRDYRKRYYTPNPLIELRTSLASGYLEVLLLRMWVIRLCEARSLSRRGAQQPLLSMHDSRQAQLQSPMAKND
ncbi:hypothetical protein [Glaciimonas sp. PCH181]|uniref:hypothetical protein n=1 Tax=Glaciimonas sp. PCH181 TaxID=2133943 RepID=UPI000D374662|nr:hypothetical protein [Glaciimonas sp. PCH181]PUA18850.1 hypothetical protein C7W93_02740 [Glaciimonas sp. PCH181]